MSFITAVSTENSTNPVGSEDISPAQFRVLFDSAIEIENIDLELVSCKVSKLNRINVITNQNTIIFRLGDASDQYKAVVKPGNYTPLELANEIASAMNSVVPTNNYKGFSASITGSSVIQLTYTRQNVPTTQTFVDNRQNFSSEGPEFGITDSSHDDSTGFVTYEYPDGQLVNNRSALKRPNDTFEFCGPMDVGQQLADFRGIDDSTRTSFHEYGIWEEAKGSDSGEFECIVKPVACCINSNFERGYGGLHLDFSGNSYFTFEIEPVLDEDGNELPVDNPEHFGSLFPNVLLNKNIPRKVKNKNERVINGVMNKVISNAFPNDLRKEPYQASKEFIFPTSVDGSTKRTLKYETNWSGQLVMKNGVGRPSKIAPFPTDYTFKMDDSTGSTARKKARSKVKKFGLQTERIRIRPSINTLMQGLFQQTGIDSNTVNDTDCILGYDGTTSHIKYIAGTEGQVNFRNNNVLDNNTQNLVPNSADQFVHTFYKIIAVDSNGQPTQVKLTDGGEHVIAFDNSSPTTYANTVMFLNDPATYVIHQPADFKNTTLDEMKEEFHYLNVASSHISQAVSNGAITTDFASRFPSFNAGLMADNIFQNNFVGHLDSNLLGGLGKDSFVDSIRERNPLSVPKNYEIDIGSKITSSNQDLNNNGLLVNIYQYQPSDADEEFSQSLDKKTDVKKLVFKGNSNSWSNLGSAPNTISNWTNFDPLSSSAAVRVRFQTEDTYTYSILLAYNTDFANNPTNFVEEQLLTRTGITRTGFRKNEALLKIRDFPLHPIFSQGTGTNKETGANKCITLVKSRGSKYELDNFQRNLNNRVIETEPPTPDLTAYNEPQISNNTGTLPPGAKPLIMVKTFPLDTNQIKTTPPITSDAINVVRPQDFTPNASLMSSGMHSVMYKQMGAGDDTMNFQTHQSTVNNTYLPTFAVEVNLPIESHIGKNFTKGQVDNVVGSGIKSKIVGVCPGTKFENQTGPIADYTYQMNYSKPVSIRLPYKASFYNMDFTLRSILDGKILKDLVHSTEVVLRMYNIVK